MNSFDIQNNISKYIHSDPDIIQDMVLEYRNYASDFIDPMSKNVKDFHFAICPRGYTTQCGFVQGATYRLLFQNQKLTNIIIIAYSNEIISPTILDDCELKSALFDVKVSKLNIYSDLGFEVSTDIEIFDKCINQLAYMYIFHKIQSVTIIVLPKSYKNIKKIVNHSDIKSKQQIGVVFVANLLEFDVKFGEITKSEFLSQNQNILDNFFANKLKFQSDYIYNFQDFEFFSKYSSIFHKKNPILAMYYDNFRLGNKHANSYVGLVV